MRRNEQAAASWIAAQVTTGAKIVCDAAMCGYLTAAGLTTSQEEVLRTGGGMTAALVVDTPQARALAGAFVVAQAPEVIASFGTGPEEVAVRIERPGGPTGFHTAAQRAIAASGRGGRLLTANSRLHLSGTARQTLVSGRVDSRLLTVLKRLLAVGPVFVTGFDDASPGAGWPALLRSVSIDGLVQGAGSIQVSDLSAVLKLLGALRLPPPPRLRQGHSHGQLVLTIEVPAPSPLRS
jgi:hypothetical protein